jgi:4-amino-4-deoxy-L-arabinose transferase-like glycosyltransferase
VSQLSDLGIFFGDAGHDIISAIEAVENKTIPLLGIESSVPRFKQGPLTVWLHMLVVLIPGKSLYLHWLLFALIGIAAVIAVYEFCTLYINKKTALLSSLILAVSPLAVAHSRMAYHVTPIPFMTVLFLAALVRLLQQKKRTVFWASLAWAGLFQFELATAPLFLIIIFILYKQKRLQDKITYNHLLQGLVLGLLPQLLFDITHRFAHLGGFLVWIAYRVVSLAPTGEHQFSLTTLNIVAETFYKYWGRIFTTQSWLVPIFMILLIAVVVVLSWKKYTHKKLPLGVEVTIFSTLLLSVSYLAHGGPSEAYFPPFFIFLPILIGYGVSLLTGLAWRLAVISSIIFAFVTTHQILTANFFVGQNSSFSYDYGIGEQRAVVSYVGNQTNNNFSFTTTNDGGKFENYFDNLRVIAWEQNTSESKEDGHVFFIENKESSLNSYPNVLKISFPSVDLYQLL